MRSDAGLSLLETVVAIAICGIILAALSTVTVSSLQESNQGNYRTQATQILDTVGRRIAGGIGLSTQLKSGESMTISGAEVDQMMSVAAFREEAFEVTIENAAVFSVGTTRLSEYHVTVCFRGGSTESCVSGVTLGRQGGNP